MRLRIARADIARAIDGTGRRVFRRADLSAVLAENREFWRLSEGTTAGALIAYLCKHMGMKRAELKFERRKELRYVWGESSVYQLALSLARDSYLCHYTAVYLHELTEQVPTTLYVNHEQSPKPAVKSELTQERIDWAFRRAPRVSSRVAQHDGYRICLVNGMYTGQLGVTTLTGDGEEEWRLTDVERTLIDIAVRPVYAGGVFEVLKAYRLAHGRISVNRLAAMLKRLDYTYPYHQAIGFYLDRSGVYTETQVRLLRKPGIDFDFYLAHNMGETDCDPKWHLFFPKGL